MSEMNARILLWGIAGCGKTTTLQTIHDKLQPDLRGDLRHEPTRLDPSIRFESLPITLGNLGGVGTQIEIIAVPGAEDLMMTRKQLLDEVDGLIFVLDCSPERIDANAAALDELRESLSSYGRHLGSLPIVLQYNKRDLADPFAIEELHRGIGLSQAAVFETIAPTGHGILSTLTTISKHVVRARRGKVESPASPAVPVTGDHPITEPDPFLVAEPLSKIEGDDPLGHEMASHEILEAAILAEGEAQQAFPANAERAESALLGLADDFAHDFENDVHATKPNNSLGDDLRIVSVGQASVDVGGGLRLPLVLGDGAGSSRSVILSLRLDALVEDGVD
jgi:signal recognition particle receptor subunit beta